MMTVVNFDDHAACRDAIEEALQRRNMIADLLLNGGRRIEVAKSIRTGSCIEVSHVDTGRLQTVAELDAGRLDLHQS